VVSSILSTVSLGNVDGGRNVEHEQLFPEEFIEHAGQYLDDQDWRLVEYKVSCSECNTRLFEARAKDWSFCPYCGEEGLAVEEDRSGLDTLKNALMHAYSEMLNE
jgi:hypothetical protein